MKRCDAGDYVVKYGEWVEVFALDDNHLIGSFKVRSNMCQAMFTRYLVFKCGMEPETEYRIKRRS